MIEEFPGGAQKLAARLVPTQHACDLSRPFRRVDCADAAFGRAAAFLLFHHKVVRRKRADLRKMRYAKNLMEARELLQLAPYDLRHRSPDTGVDLVENQRRHLAPLRLAAFQREHYPR